MKLKSLLNLTFFLCVVSCGYCQEVTVSKEFNLRNDYSYDILGKIGENIVLFRDRGLDYTLELLDDNLEYKKEAEIIFEKAKVEIIDLVELDTTFSIYYSYKKDGQTIVSSRSYNQKIEPIDSTLLYTEKTKVFKKRFELVVSQDKSKVLLYSYQTKNKLNIVAWDQREKDLIYDDVVEYENYDLRDHLKNVLINNSAEVFLLFEKDNRRVKKEEHYAEINYIKPNQDDILTNTIRLNDILSSDIEMEYDEFNKKILVAGLYHDKNKLSSRGYFFAQTLITSFSNLIETQIVPYNDFVLKEVYGKTKDLEKDLQHYRINEIIFRRDGGFILVTEMNKELARRNYYNGYNRFADDQTGGVWKDFYNENVILFALKPSGLEHWTKVLHKKQFSQDDDDIYGSFFSFKSPSRLRLIYNDEIKINSTVSEYVVDPLGRFERNAVLSTDYQNLRLRFKDAIQLSPNELLIPSQRSYTLNLVKIRYN